MRIGRRQLQVARGRVANAGVHVENSKQQMRLRMVGLDLLQSSRRQRADRKEMKDKQIKGFLLKSVTTVTTSPMMKGTPVSQVATSVEKGPIPASTFEPPAGYQKQARGR
jgi:hypothetical protein